MNGAVNGAGAAQGARWRSRFGARLRSVATRLPDGALAIVAAVLAAGLVLVINETSHARSSVALARLAQRAQAVAHLDTMMRRVLDAETAVRGYLLTGRDAYLGPYRDAAADTRASVAWLSTHYGGDAASGALLAQFREHAGHRHAALAATLGAVATGARDPGARPAGADRGPNDEMKTLRGLSDQLMAREQDAVAADQQAVLDTLRTSRFGVNATAAIGILVLLMLVRQTRTLDRFRHQHTRALQAERERLESDVRDRTADLTELARHLQTVREDESRRLARVLHEELGALLTAARLDLTRLRHGLGDARPEVTTRLDHLNAGLDNGIALKRRIIENLHPSSLANLGLVAALQIQLREFAERTGVRVEADLHEVALSDAAQITVYRMVQEALTNIAKYAQAHRVSVGLRERPAVSDAADARASVAVSIVDDGCGFEPTATRRSAHGLMGMRYRVEAVGGTLGVRTAPGAGTRLEATLPALPAGVTA